MKDKAGSSWGRGASGRHAALTLSKESGLATAEAGASSLAPEAQAEERGPRRRKLTAAGFASRRVGGGVRE